MLIVLLLAVASSALFAGEQRGALRATAACRHPAALLAALCAPLWWAGVGTWARLGRCSH